MSAVDSKWVVFMVIASMPLAGLSKIKLQCWKMLVARKSLEPKNKKEEFSNSQSRDTLAAVARSCKTLSSVALDILW